MSIDLLRISCPDNSLVPSMRELWQEAFGDSNEALDSFFETAYSPDRCRVVTSGKNLLSALYIFFRDIQYLWTIFVQLLMYMSAIFYSVDAYSETVQRVFLINPVYVYIKYFRCVVIDNSVPSLELNVLAILYALLAFGIGALIYKKCNHKFLYYV